MPQFRVHPGTANTSLSDKPDDRADVKQISKLIAITSLKTTPVNSKPAVKIGTAPLSAALQSTTLSWKPKPLPNAQSQVCYGPNFVHESVSISKPECSYAVLIGIAIRAAEAANNGCQLPVLKIYYFIK